MIGTSFHPLRITPRVVVTPQWFLRFHFRLIILNESKLVEKTQYEPTN